MTPRSFFTILLKIIGIYFFLQIITAIPQLFTTISFFISQNPGQYAISEALIILLSMVYYVFVLWLCFYKTDYIIDKLSLDKHFTEDRFELNIHRSTVLRIAIIILGALILIDTLPSFCKQIFKYFEHKIQTDKLGDNPATGYLIGNYIQLITGLIFLQS